LREWQWGHMDLGSGREVQRARLEAVRERDFFRLGTAMSTSVSLPLCLCTTNRKIPPEYN